MSSASELPRQALELSIRERFRQRLRSRLSTTPTNIRSSVQTVSTSNPPPVPFLSGPIIASASVPPLLQAASNANIYDNALSKLSDRDRAAIRSHVLPTTDDIDVALIEALATVKLKQLSCKEKRKFMFAGREIDLKEEADKVIHWLNRFKTVGDVAANANAVYAGLPWAGIRLLLEVAVSDASQMASLLVGCETALYMANRLKVYMNFLDGLPATLTRTNFEIALTKLYVRLLQFLAQAIRIYETSRPKRAFKAFWEGSEVENFEQECDKLGQDLEIEASNCDRSLAEQDRELYQQLEQDLHMALEELKKVHQVQESLNRLETIFYLDKLPYTRGAMFNSYDQDHTTCHPATRVNILRQIYDWAQQPQSKNIFWLNGMAGIGKSTISWSFAKWLTDQSQCGDVSLGASFFFKRGEGDRGNASRFFSTIIRDLILKVPSLESVVVEVIASDPTIFDKALGEQFDKLIFRPLRQLTLKPDDCPTLVVIVDAMDECEKEKDIQVILDLWSRLPQITTVRLKLFLTSRPELPIRLGFKAMSADVHHDMVLHNEAEVPKTTIQDDIATFLRDKFSEIREMYNANSSLDTGLCLHWPSQTVLEAIVNIAVPLFIVATTICRYIGDPNFDPQERLEQVMQFQQTGRLEQVERTYLPVLKQLPSTLSESRDEEKLYQEFRLIVGSIITLAEPLSVASLATLLDISHRTIVLRLLPLCSVLRVPTDSETPIRTLHLSFSEFLLSEKLQHQPFRVDGPATHRILLGQCLRVLSSPNGLRENTCDLSYPGQPKRELEPAVISERLPPPLHYACQYWVYHAQHSNIQLHDDHEVYYFLRTYFLYWLEAQSLISRLSEVIGHIVVLQSLLSANNVTILSSFLEDAHRIVLANRQIVDVAPLQIYSSAMVFAPQESLVRKICGKMIPPWLKSYPITPLMWGLELQSLEGHGSCVWAVAFSHDDTQLASGSSDYTVRLWHAATGQELQKLEGHTDAVFTVAFSPDGARLASGSRDKSLRLWNVATGQVLRVLEGHNSEVSAVAFSPNDALASGSWDHMVRVWSAVTGQELHTLEGHTDRVDAVAFSPDGALLASGSWDHTVRLWSAVTGQELQTLEGHTGRVRAVAFSPDGALLASGSSDETVRLWNVVTKQELYTLESHGSSVYTVAFSPDSARLASGSDNNVRLWNVVAGQDLQILEGHTNTVMTVAFSHDGARLASGSHDHTVRLWSMAKGQEPRKHEGHTDMVTSLIFSHNHAQLASASGWTMFRGLTNTEQKLQTLEMDTKKCHRITLDDNQVAFLYENMCLTPSDDCTVKFFDTTTGRVLHTLERHTYPVFGVAFSHNDAWLASGSWDGTIILWNTTTGQALHILERHTAPVDAVAFSHNDAWLASGSWDGTIILWNTTTGQALHILEGHTAPIDAVAFSHNDAWLASGSWDGTIILWNTTTGQALHTLEGHTDQVNAVAFSHNDAWLASGSWDGTIILWNTTTGQAMHTLEGHTDQVNAVAFSPDGARLVSGSQDHTVRLWCATTGQALHTYEWYTNPVNEVAFSHDGSTLITNQGTITIGSMSSINLVVALATNPTLAIEGDWIQHNECNVLWLPSEYRSAKVAFCNDAFAFGLQSGQVLVLHLRH